VGKHANWEQTDPFCRGINGVVAAGTAFLPTHESGASRGGVVDRACKPDWPIFFFAVGTQRAGVCKGHGP